MPSRSIYNQQGMRVSGHGSGDFREVQSHRFGIDAWQDQPCGCSASRTVQRHRLWVQRHCSATSKDQRHRSATLKLEATSQSANHPSQHNKNLIYELRKAPSKPSSSFGASMSRNFTSTVALHPGLSPRKYSSIYSANHEGRAGCDSLMAGVYFLTNPHFQSEVQHLALIPVRV